MRFVFNIVVLLALLAALPAFAAPDKDKKDQKDQGVPPGTIGSGTVTLEQLTKELQFLTAQKEGIVVNFILPKNWELIEEGIDAKTGKVREDLNVYSLLSRRPVTDPKDPTPFIFELDIYKHGLTEAVKADPKTGQLPTTAEQFKNSLDLQMSSNIKGGLKVKSKPADIVPRVYGPGKTRPQTIFVPISYETPTGAMLYTFTSVAADSYHFQGCPYAAKFKVPISIKDAEALGYNACMLCEPRDKNGPVSVDKNTMVSVTHSGKAEAKVWQMKFLVNKDQVDNYGALIALMLDNAFGLTEAEYQGLLANSPTSTPKPDAPK
jgi:hypothetical protein